MSKKSLSHEHQSQSALAAKYLPETPTLKTLKDKARACASWRTSPDVLQALRTELAGLVKKDVALERSFSLLESGSFVICAGQQPGLFGGTLLSYYKAATAIQLAKQLTDEGIPTVPIFWNASEDHDFDEANRVCVLPEGDSDEAQLFQLPRDESQLALSKIVLDQHARDQLHRLTQSQNLHPDFLPVSSETIGSWNTRLMHQMTQGTGLVICEPAWFAAQVGTLRSNMIEARPAINQLIGDRTKQLAEDGFDTPIHFDVESETALFYTQAGPRTKVKLNSDGQYYAGEMTWSKSDLIQAVSSHADHFSSNVISRPLVQQTVLPVLAQISGPSELSYLAQLYPVFKHLEVTPPIVWPRSRFLLLPKRARQIIENLQIPRTQLKANNPPLSGFVTTSQIDKDRDVIEKVLFQTFAEIDGYQHRENQTLAFASRKLLTKHWKVLKKDLKKTEKKRTKPQSRALHQLRQFLEPRGIHQERILSFFGLRYPLDDPIYRSILNATDPFSFEVTILDID